MVTGFESKDYDWTFPASVYFALVGGTESLIGYTSMTYSLVTPELKFSHQDASLFVASYWAGIFVGRLLATIR